MRRVPLVLLSAALALDASADSGAADRAAAEARTRAANNDFVGAAAKYREAFKAEPRPELMCNVGVAYYKAKDLPRAQRYLDQCLSIGTSLDRAFIDNVKKVLGHVESTLAAGTFTPVDLLVQPTAATTTVEGGLPFDEPILGSRRVWFPFGRYRLTVHAEGHVDRVIEIDAKDRTAVPARASLAIAPVAETGSGTGSAEPVPEPEPVKEPVAAGSGSAAVEAMPAPRVRATRSIVPPIAATAASSIAGIVALGYFVAARDSADQAGKTDDRGSYDKLVDEAHDRQRMSWLLGGVAGVGAIASAVLWYRYASPPRVEVQASGTGAGVTFSGRW